MEVGRREKDLSDARRVICDCKLVALRVRPLGCEVGRHTRGSYRSLAVVDTTRMTETMRMTTTAPATVTTHRDEDGRKRMLRLRIEVQSPEEYGT